MAEVSVITTVYNGEAYFDRSVPGILGQTFGDFEWVIVDDGSTDGTAARLAELAHRDRRIVLVSPGRIGRSAALNLAVETAAGRLVVQQDFDDVSYADRLARQVPFLDAHPEVGLVGSHYVVIDEIRGERYVRRSPSEHEAIVRTMAKNIPFAHTMVTFRKEAWLSAGRYPSAKAMIDFRLFIEMARHGWKLANLPEVLGEHYVHGESYWHKSDAYGRAQREMVVLQLQAIRKLDIPPSMLIYPVGRLLYRHLSTQAKRFVRRQFAGSQEIDL